MMKIVHEKYKTSKKIVDPAISDFQSSFDTAQEYNRELVSLLNKAQVSRTLKFHEMSEGYSTLIFLSKNGDMPGLVLHQPVLWYWELNLDLIT